MNRNKVLDTLRQNIIDVKTRALLQIRVHTSLERPLKYLLVILTREQDEGSVTSLLPQPHAELNPAHSIHCIVANDATEVLMVNEIQSLLSGVSGLEYE